MLILYILKIFRCFQLGLDNGSVAMYVFGMFYCGTISVGQDRILEISDGFGKPMWVTWKDNGGIKACRLWCPLLEQSTAFFKVLCIVHFVILIKRNIKFLPTYYLNLR